MSSRIQVSVQRPPAGGQEAGADHTQRQEGEEVRQAAYRDLLVYAGRVRGYALAAIPELRSHQPKEACELFAGKVLAEKLARAVGLLEKVISQTERRQGIR